METHTLSPDRQAGADSPSPAPTVRIPALTPQGSDGAKLREGLGRASLIRHAGIFAAAAAAYLLRGEIQVDNRVLWILALSAALNLLVYFLGSRPRLGARVASLSPTFGIAGWTAMVHVTGGVASPFVIGLGLEIVLAAVTSGPAGIAIVSAVVAAALWGQQIPLGIEPVTARLAIQTACLLGTGATTVLLSRHWARAHRNLSSEQARLRERLESLEREMDDVRALGEVGENVARLTHALKNAIHGLRGCAGLIESHLMDRPEHSALIEGLRSSVDRLEELSRGILSGNPPGSERREPCAPAAVSDAIREALDEVSGGYPGVAWRHAVEETAARLGMPPASLREILVVLLRNAAEAVEGQGPVTVEAERVNGHFRIVVRDEGPSVPAADLDRLFRPGFTTKPGGSGYGLFLARRLAEAHGGGLTVLTGGSGMTFQLTIPVLDPGEAS